TVVDECGGVQAWVATGGFFFQAEDGIRDLIVTGVQTCALPICSVRGALSNERPYRDRRYAPKKKQHVKALIFPSFFCAFQAALRSEERRVGKECRSRWWADC